MGKHTFTELVHLENKSYSIHKDLGTVGLLGWKKPRNYFSRIQTRENPSSFSGSLHISNQSTTLTGQVDFS